MLPVFVGEVVSAGLMQRTVKVRVPHTKLHPVVLKWVTYHKTFFVHDPDDSLCVGDIVRIKGSQRISKRKHFVVDEVVKPAARYIDTETGSLHAALQADAKRDIRETGKEVQRSPRPTPQLSR